MTVIPGSKYSSTLHSGRKLRTSIRSIYIVRASPPMISNQPHQSDSLVQRRGALAIMIITPIAPHLKDMQSGLIRIAADPALGLYCGRCRGGRRIATTDGCTV